MRWIMIARRNNLRDHNVLRRARGMAAAAGLGAGEGQQQSGEGATKVDRLTIRGCSPPTVTLQHKKLGKKKCYLDLFHHKGVFICRGLVNQTVLQSEPLKRATLLQGQCPQNGWLLKAILPCHETGVSGEKIIARLLCLCRAVLHDLVALRISLPSLRL
jgi:hypothetical protein